MISNNDILRRLRYTFDLGDSQMMAHFEQGGLTVTRATVSDWLKKAEDPAFQPLRDQELAIFLNGFIIARRGARPGPPPLPEARLDNNLILKKLKIALNLRQEDLLAIFQSAGVSLSPHELSAFFRRPHQARYRPCQDQYLRNFLAGLQRRYAPTPDPPG